MSKNFFEMMDGVLEQYADAKSKQIAGVNMHHYYETLKTELAFDVQRWFLKQVDTIAGHKQEIKSVLLNTNSKPGGAPHPPTDRKGLDL